MGTPAFLPCQSCQANPLTRPQVARDACGTPLRPFWPYVMDPQSIESVRREQVFEVGSCWNGVVAFKAGLVAYQGMHGAGMMNATGVSEVRKRGWQMVDNGAFFGCASERRLMLCALFPLCSCMFGLHRSHVDSIGLP
jgi:hypothetical protein